MELCVAKQTEYFSVNSLNFSPTTAKSNILYKRRLSQRPRRKSRPENTAFSVLLYAKGSDKTYSKHVAGVCHGPFGFPEADSSALE